MRYSYALLPVAAFQCATAFQATVPPAARTVRPFSKQFGRGRALIAPSALNAGVSGSLLELMPLSLSTSAADYQFQGSYASLYVTLFLFVLSFPGIISLVTRSVKISVDQRTYVLPGPESGTTESPAKSTRQVAAEIMAYFQANNYKVADAGETIVFKGEVKQSVSQACFLSFCLFGGLWCLALVLSIQLPTLGPLEVGNYYYAMCLLSPYAGYYYWTNAASDDEVRVRLLEDKGATEVTVQASKEALDQFAGVMDFNEKGKVRIRGIFEGSDNEE